MVTHYHDFDKYMIKLDPISGYLGSAFGKEDGENNQGILLVMRELTET